MQRTLDTTASKRSRFQTGFGVVVYSVLLGAIVALLAGVYEIVFKTLASDWHHSNYLSRYVPTWLIYAVGPFIACPILYWIVTKMPEKRPHNPADLIASVHVNDGKINASASMMTVIASVFSIGLGFSVGYYAPALQLGASIGAFFKRLRWIRPTHAYISIGSGAAAAIAAIFHSPIGAVVFVHEVLFRFFSVRAFAPVTIAAVTAYVISGELFSKTIVFEVSQLYVGNTPTYFIAALGGMLAAFVGVSLLNTILTIQRFSQHRQLSSMRQLLIAATLTALIIVLVPQAAGSDLPAMQNVLVSQYFTFAVLLMIFVAKFCATSVAFGFGVPGGIFGPTIFLGAALGGLLADGMVLLSPALADSHQIIIITTMAAMISAVLGAPIAMILIVVEITGNFQLISVVMLAVVMANVTSYRLMGTSSFFDLQLKSRGFDFDSGRDRLYAEHRLISDLITDDFLSVASDTNLIIAEQQLIETSRDDAYVIDTEGNLRGYVTLVDIEWQRFKHPDAQSLASVIVTDAPVLYASTSIWHAIQVMSHSNRRCLPVIDGENNPQLLGVIYTQDLMAQYFSHLKHLREEENLT